MRRLPLLVLALLLLAAPASARAATVEVQRCFDVYAAGTACW